MINEPISNPNEFKVVEFVNATDFNFTSEMGCMYDGRPIFGISGIAGIAAGERMDLPYDVGMLLANNLAKQALIRMAPPHDPKDNNPIGAPLWTDEKLKALKDSFITEKYTNEKPVAMSETDKLMKQVADLNKLVRDNLPNIGVPQIPEDGSNTASASEYKDKAEVIVELKKRGIVYNPRESKAKLEQLLA